MSREPGAVGARTRLVLAVIVGGAVALLVPSLSATTVDASSTVVLGVVAVTLAAVLGRRQHVVTTVADALAPPPCVTDAVPSVLVGRATDPAHHPLRPRAPGLV